MGKGIRQLHLIALDWAVFSFVIFPMYCLAQPVPVRGDQATLDLLVKAQTAHRESLYEGYWEGAVAKPGESGNLKLYWSGESRRVEFEIKSDYISGTLISGIAVRDRLRQAIYFDNDLVAIGYDGIATTFPGPAEFLPQNAWFSEFIRPNEWLLNYREPQGPVTGFEVNETATVIEVTRSHEGGSELRMVFSREAGLNLIKYYWRNAPDDYFRTEGESTWEQSSHGCFFPREFRVWRHFGKRKPDSLVFESITKRFDPANQLNNDKFTLKGIDLPKGTEIKYCNAIGEEKSREVVGGEQAKRERQLRLLAAELAGKEYSTINYDRK